MHCNTSAICSASGDSESQIRPTLTAIDARKKFIRIFISDSLIDQYMNNEYQVINFKLLDFIKLHQALCIESSLRLPISGQFSSKRCT